jgi:hypothetical protein
MLSPSIFRASREEVVLPHSVADRVLSNRFGQEIGIR